MNEQKELRTSKYKPLYSIASWSKNIAWIVLVIYILVAIQTFFQSQDIFVSLISKQNSGTGVAGLLTEVLSIMSILIPVLGDFLKGVVYFLTLKGISLGLYMLVETDVNYREVREDINDNGFESPEESESAQEQTKNDDDDDSSFTEMELKIIEDENPPVFYDPFDVWKLNKFIEWAAKSSIVIAIGFGFVAWTVSQSVLSQTYGGEFFFMNVCGTILILITAIGFQIIFIYIPLKALARILNMLMEMEFNSRKGM